MAGPSSAWQRLRERLLSIDPENSLQTPDLLTVAALVYLALPSLIFLGGWLRLPFAVVTVALLAGSMGQFMRRADVQWRQPYALPALLLIVAAGVAWCVLGGAGHFFYANPDWIIRDKVFGDLTLTPWPAAYSFSDGYHHILRSAFGYFFPAAVVGKLFGLGHMDLALYLWTALGATLFLLLLPLPRHAGGLLLLMLTIVVGFSGMDFLGIVLITGDTPVFPLRLEWWLPFSYPSLTGQLYWGPNHAIALWLVTALFYRHWGHRSFPALVVVILPMLVIWTPFAVAGILPFVGIAIARWFSQGRSIRDWNLTAVQCLAAAMLTYLSVRVLTLDIAAIPSAPSIEAAPNKDGFWLNYLVFILMEFAILAVLLARELRHSYGLFWLAVAGLTLLPFYQYGPSNDTMLRLSTPCLVILLILTLDRVNAWASKPDRHRLPARAWAIGLVLLIGANTPCNEMWRAATFHRIPPNYGLSMVEYHGKGEPPHYVGRLDKPVLLFLLRTPSLIPTHRQQK